MNKKLMVFGVVGAAVFAQQAAARDFTIAAWGGVYQDAQREAHFQPFAAKEGITFIEATYLGGLAEIKGMSDTGQVTWDVVMGSKDTAQTACDEGLVEEIDWAAFKGDELIEAAKGDCFVGNAVISTGIGYNADLLKTAPQSWADFFDLAAFPGKRGVYNSPVVALEAALMADGVAPADVYATLATQEGQDRAFSKLDTIKPHMQLWEAGAQPVEWLASGNVAISMAYSGRIAAAQTEGKNLKYVWNNSAFTVEGWMIPADSENAELAQRFVQWVSSPEGQAKFSSLMAYGPTNPAAAALIPEERRAILPVGENMNTALAVSSDFWLENRDKLRKRWMSWVVQ